MTFLRSCSGALLLLCCWGATASSLSCTQAAVAEGQDRVSAACSISGKSRQLLQDDSACTTLQPLPIPANPNIPVKSCVDMVPDEEVIRGLGAFYDPTAGGGYLGSWWISWELNRPLCRQCRWNASSAHGVLRPSEFLGQDPQDIQECPPCVGEIYRSRNYTDRMAPPLTRGACPQGWIYSPVSDHCYWRNPLQRPMNYINAKTFCESLNTDPNLGGTSQMLKVETSEENEWLLSNLMWRNGHLSDVWTGLYKAPFSYIFYWADGHMMNRDDFQYWSGPESATPGNYDVNSNTATGICVKYLPHMDPRSDNRKQWIAWDCGALVPVICERYPYRRPIDPPTPPGTPPIDQPAVPPAPSTIPIDPPSGGKKGSDFPITPVVAAGSAVVGLLLLILAICAVRAVLKRKTHHNIYLSHNNEMLAPPRGLLDGPGSGDWQKHVPPADSGKAVAAAKAPPEPGHPTPSTVSTIEWNKTGTAATTAVSSSQWPKHTATSATQSTDEWRRPGPANTPIGPDTEEWGRRAPANTPATQATEEPVTHLTSPAPTAQATGEWGRQTAQFIPATQAADEWGRRTSRTQSTENAFTNLAPLTDEWGRRTSRTPSTDNAFQGLPATEGRRTSRTPSMDKGLPPPPF